MPFTVISLSLRSTTFRLPEGDREGKGGAPNFLCSTGPECPRDEHRGFLVEMNGLIQGGGFVPEG